LKLRKLFSKIFFNLDEQKDATDFGRAFLQHVTIDVLW